MRIALLLGMCALSTGVQAGIVAGEAPAEPQASLQKVVVAGSRPGPALWKVSSGDHSLWILGTVSPVPKDMEWYSPQSEATLRRAQEIIGRPGVIANLGAGGMFKAALALPAILRARKNPDGKELREVLPPELYARWSTLKAKYLGKDEEVERWRPIFAAEHIYQAAISQAGLRSDAAIGARVGQLVKEYKLKRTSTQVSRKIDDPRGMAKSLARTELDEAACFRSVLDRLELDVARAGQRARAWAIGDVAELARLLPASGPEPCFEVIARTEAFRSLDLDKAGKQSEVLWLQAAERALASNDTTFATLEVAELLGSEGLLARLRAKGYAVVAPD